MFAHFVNFVFEAMAARIRLKLECIDDTHWMPPYIPWLSESVASVACASVLLSNDRADLRSEKPFRLYTMKIELVFILVFACFLAIFSGRPRLGITKLVIQIKTLFFDMRVKISFIKLAFAV